jgi:hypothetical protein
MQKFLLSDGLRQESLVFAGDGERRKRLERMSRVRAWEARTEWAED